MYKVFQANAFVLRTRMSHFHLVRGKMKACSEKHLEMLMIVVPNGSKGLKLNCVRWTLHMMRK